MIMIIGIARLLAKVIGGVGVDAEIADEQRGQGIEAEGSQERANPRANDHGAISAASTVKATGMMQKKWVWCWMQKTA
jgi:hypothetical protein